MLESEPGGDDFAVVVEDNVADELFPTDTIMLAAVALDFDLHKLLNLSVKVQHAHSITATGFIPGATAIYKILEGADPGVDRCNHSVIEGGKLDLDGSHLLKIARSLIVNVLED